MALYLLSNMGGSAPEGEPVEYARRLVAWLPACPAGRMEGKALPCGVRASRKVEGDD